MTACHLEELFHDVNKFIPKTLIAIHTLSSKDPSVIMLTLEAIQTYREISISIYTILSQIIDIEKNLKEYYILTNIKEFGDSLVTRLL